MAYRALYREYRPRTFHEVIGQDHITTVLKNQVETDHIAHAYLFCGTRGTGKTSTAKILARAVNCLDPIDGEPCMHCRTCLDSLNDTNGDILELDAASNNGVDDARAIIEQAQYAPLSMRRRVFIIDEVHMLSNSAFNALLKTLEEPPAHVLFILATTEPQKLPATIISRCQRFDFRRLSTADIVRNLTNVLEKVGATIDEEGLMLIARAADGGMRDALSLTDQCLSFIGETVTKRDVYDVLGSMDDGFLFDLAEALLRSDIKTALTMLDEVIRGGRDLTVFTNDLATHFRSLLIAKSCGAAGNLLDCTEDAMARYQAQAKAAGEAQLLLALEALLNAQGTMRYLSSPRTLIESVLVRICRPEDRLALDTLEARIVRLEQRAASAPLAPIAPAVESVKSKTVATAPKRQDHPAVDEAPPWDDIPLPEPPPEEASGYAYGMGEAEERTPVTPPPVNRPAPKPVPRTEKRPAASPAPMTRETGSPATFTAGALWERVLADLYKQNILVHAMARYGAPISLADGSLTIGFDAAHKAQRNGLAAPINYTKLQGILTKLLPDTQLNLIEAESAPASEASIEKAKQLFGDKLVIKG